jgi:hypothetical protein
LRAFEAFCSSRVSIRPSFFKPSKIQELSRHQVLDNLVQWEKHRGEGYIFPIGHCGFVPHPRKESLGASLSFVRIQGESYIVRGR